MKGGEELEGEALVGHDGGGVGSSSRVVVNLEEPRLGGRVGRGEDRGHAPDGGCCVGRVED